MVYIVVMLIKATTMKRKLLIAPALILLSGGALAATGTIDTPFTQSATEQHQTTAPQAAQDTQNDKPATDATEPSNDGAAAPAQGSEGTDTTAVTTKPAAKPLPAAVCRSNTPDANGNHYDVACDQPAAQQRQAASQPAAVEAPAEQPQLTPEQQAAINTPNQN